MDDSVKKWGTSSLASINAYSKSIAEILADEDEKILNALDAALVVNDQNAIEAAFDRLEGKMATNYTVSNTSGGIGGTITISGGNAGTTNIGTANGFTVSSTGSQYYIPVSYGSWAYSTYDGYYGSGRYPSAKKPCCEREIQEYKGKK